MLRFIFTLIMFLAAVDVYAVTCFAADLSEDLPRRFASSDVVFLARYFESGDFEAPVLVSVDAVWKGFVSDKAAIHTGTWESIRYDGEPFLVFANSESDGFHSTLGACLSMDLWSYERRSGVSPLKLMTENFGEPSAPSWPESLAVTYFSFFMLMAVLIMINLGIAKLVSPNKALKLGPVLRASTGRSYAAPLN